MSSSRQTGYVLITALLLLAAITILGVTAVSTVTLQERMVSNMQEKQRSVEAAAIALRSGEGFLYGLANYPDKTTLPGNTAVDIQSAGVVAGVVSNPVYTLSEVDMGALTGALTPETQRGGRSEAKVFYYSVVARGAGGNASAVTLLQSIYGRIY